MKISQAKPILTPPAHKIEKLETVTTEEIWNTDYKPMPNVIEGLLPAGMTVFAAPAKTGKSWLCLALGEAITNSMNFFGRKTLPGSALYLDLEGHAYRIKERMRLMNCMPSSRFHTGFKSSNLREGLLEQLDEWKAENPDARLVILDTLVRVKGESTRRTDAYNADSQLLAPLQKWALDQNIAVLVVTHLNKQTRYVADADPFERITGSNGQFAIADAAWLITGKRDDEQRHLIVYGRDVGAQDLVIAFNKRVCRWECVGDAESVQRTNAVKSPIVRTIFELLDKESCGIINITAQKLLEECSERYGTTEQITPSELGKQMKVLMPIMESFGVRYEPPKSGGRKGRLHRFVRTAG